MPVRLAPSVNPTESLTMTTPRGMIAPPDPQAQNYSTNSSPGRYLILIHILTRTVRRLATSTRFWDTITIPNSHTPPGCRPSRSVRNLIPATRSLHLAEHLGRIDNTVQYSWLLEIVQTFHGFRHDRIDPKTIGDLYDRANSR